MSNTLQDRGDQIDLMTVSSYLNLTREELELELRLSNEAIKDTPGMLPFNIVVWEYIRNTSLTVALELKKIPSHA